MGEESLISCSRCSTKREMCELKFDKAQNVLLCAKCYYHLYAKERKDRIVQAASVHRIHYACLSCGHKFSRSFGFEFGGICVHCGRKTVLREDTNELVVKPAKTLLDY